jgi:DeoR/GlpR family transcriptional regulator of sugar metabolism
MTQITEDTGYQALKQERQRHLLEVLEREGRVLSSELSVRWGLSEDTIRRDLREMEQGGMLQRVHGGALPRSPGALPYDARRRLDVASKSAIAQRAANLIIEGQTVFIDGGTTTVEIASHLLRDRRATIITNSPPLALALADHSKLDVLLLGGRLLKDARVTVGADTVREIASIRADLCLLGMCSLHPDIGITVGSVEEACVKRAMIATSAEVVGLISHGKMGKILPYVVGPASALTQLITDVSDEVVLEPYRSQGICITALNSTQ